MWLVIDRYTNVIISRSYSFYVADKVRSSYDGAVRLVRIYF